MAKYYTQHQWAPKSNGSIEMKEGQEGFRLKKIKNDSCRYTVTCEWRLHALCLPDGVTYIIKSVLSSHSFCQRVVENKEANARWVASVLQTTIYSNPTIEAKVFRNELQNRFGVRCDRQTLYRAKNIVLKTMKANHVNSYAKLKKHMLANFKCVFKNHNINGKLWHTTRVGSVVDFKEALKWVGEDSVDAVNWLMSESVEKWARHAFDSRIKSDHITNNMSGCFNGWIKDERDKPILTLLELSRRKIMVRFAEKWNDSITPYAREQLMMNEKEGRKLDVIHGRGEWYETLKPCGNFFLVHIGNVHYDCGMWLISGIPCMNAVAVFMYNRQFAHEHVHWYYSKEVMNPYGLKLDDGNANEVVESPQKRTKVGRPKKARRRAADEPHAPTKIFSNKCKGCNTIGLNICTCPNKGKEKDQARKEKKVLPLIVLIIMHGDSCYFCMVAVDGGS
ncbi:hypothetical protein ACOSQ3_022372 [Xanthoceras sorbifolium]